jgi:polyhydroxyalkanoate synthesis repressor PhaR
MVVVKKYGNRRLYDTGDSRYITLADLARTIQGGADVRVVDASSGADLTQATLTQIIIERRGAARLLPLPLLVRLIRMGDEALADFFGRFLSWALDLYVHRTPGARTVAPWAEAAPAPAAAARPAGETITAQDVASLRRELEELRDAIRRGARGETEG